MASTVHGMMPASSVQRYSQSEKEVVSVSRPCLFTAYNKGMEGTDRMVLAFVKRNGGGQYSHGFWTQQFTTHGYWLKVLVPTYHNLNSGDRLLRPLLRYGTMPKSAGRPSTSKASTLHDSRVSDDIRFDGRDHLVIATADGKRRRCAGKNCVSVVRTECQKRGFGLCIPCFVPFHTK